jgi:hypothetical protein
LRRWKRIVLFIFKGNSTLTLWKKQPLQYALLPHTRHI